MKRPPHYALLSGVATVPAHSGSNILPSTSHRLVISTSCSTPQALQWLCNKSSPEQSRSLPKAIHIRKVSIISGTCTTICRAVIVARRNSRSSYYRILGVSVQNFTHLGESADFLRPFIWSRECDAISRWIP
jgi:hypothetical protein